MKKKSNDHEPEKTEKEKLVEALTGPDDDFEDEGCSEEYLTACGIDPSTLVSEFKEHLQEKARQQQAEKGIVSSSISGALRSIRDYVKSSDPMNVDPEAHIDNLLGGLLAGGAQGTGVAYAFRGQTDEEMTDEDEEILDTLKAELDEGDQ